MSEEEADAPSDDFDYVFDDKGELQVCDTRHGRRLLQGVRRINANQEGEFADLLKSIEKNLVTLVITEDEKGNKLQYPKLQSDLAPAMTALNESRTTHTLCDVVLCVGDTKFHCHRAVLAASSPFFATLLLGEFRERKDEKVRLNDVPSHIVSDVLDYFYTGSIYIRNSNVESMLHAASLFQLSSVVTACCKYLSRQLDSDNCFGILHFAEFYSCKTLVEEARAFAMDNFPDTVRTGEFELLSYDQVLFFLTDERCQWCKESVYEAVMKWTKSDTTRLQFLPALLRCADLRLMTEDYFKFNVKHEPLIQNDPECFEMIQEVEEDLFQQRTQRLPAEILVQVGGISGSEAAGHKPVKVPYMDCLGPWRCSHAILSDLPFSLVSKNCYLNVLAMDDDIYILASMERCQAEDPREMQFWRYVSSADLWLRLPEPLTFHQGQFGFVAAGGRLYAIGTNMTAEKGAECYESFSPRNNRWRKIARVPHTVHKTVTSSCKDKVVVMGYWEGRHENFYVQTYDSSTDNWEHYDVDSYHCGKPQYQSAVLGSKIYLMPLLGRRFSMCAFDVESREFEKLPMPQQSHLHGGMAVVNGKIVLTGGSDYFKAYTCPVIELLDPERREWLDVGRQVEHLRRAHAAVTIRDCGWIHDKLVKAIEENRKKYAELDDFTAGYELARTEGEDGLPAL
ncbi:PREDICTED: kelch-like protein 21 [Branchiostoma belcheri]|uniref:Kelch-like protein 21 n=1 Tax=Branchiostoma belcheri TaxID=7741 RepID=A0A6P4ZY11_BRABE|nr:PREDICTED: kelch-like protein 21 [Branchiostoma belcheri]